MASKKTGAKVSPGLRKMYERLMDSLPNDGLHIQARAMAGYLGRLKDAVDAMERLAQNRNPTETEAKHQQRVAEAAKRIEKRTAEVWDRLNEQFRDGVVQLEERMNEKANLRPNEYASEIRASIRAMDPADRRTVLHNALRDGDAATVAALTNAPSVVTGIEGEYAGRIKQAFLEQHAPEEAAAMDTLHSTMSTVMSAASSTKQAAAEATDPEYISRIQREAEAAQQSQNDFDEAMAE